MPVVLPPPDEQAAIVRFLDHANRKIDSFLRAKRKLIGLLNEQKQAIIHRPSPAASTPTSPSSPPASPGSATSRRIGIVGHCAAVYRFVRATLRIHSN